MATPIYTNEEQQAHATFTAIMWAMSYPGRDYLLPAATPQPMAAIAESLIDLETSYYTPDLALDQIIARAGGRRRDPGSALYQFFPQFEGDHLQLLTSAPQGTLRDPDQSATLVIGCALGAGPALRLSGPGIPGAASLQVSGLPPGFWDMRRRAIRYPLGWDLVLIDGRRVVALPRTTLIEEVG